MSVLESFAAAVAEREAEWERRLEKLEAEVVALRKELAETHPRLLTTDQFCEEYGVRKGTLKRQMFHRETNGLAAAFVQRERRGKVWINPRAYFEAIQAQGTKRRRRRR